MANGRAGLRIKSGAQQKGRGPFHLELGRGGGDAPASLAPAKGGGAAAGDGENEGPKPTVIASAARQSRAAGTAVHGKTLWIASLRSQ
ncbi:hypothetical protein [Parasphingorhabdus sp.]|uniref:hypothetical protein n=1 Tax=Parasphingorhabdus sp. TaxID=2709688 RepID=UPI003001D85B